MSRKNMSPLLHLTDKGGGKAWIHIEQECDWNIALNITSLLKQNVVTKNGTLRTRAKENEMPNILNSGGKGEGWLRARIIEDIRVFCKKFKITTTDFGIKALNDGSFFGRLEKGRSTGIDRVEHLYTFMESHSINNILR
jgi:hypothetical protein